MNFVSLLSLLGASLVREQIRRAQRRAMWLIFAGVAGAGSLLAFILALHRVISDALDPLKADLIIGGILLVIALSFVLAAKMVGKSSRIADINPPMVRDSVRYVAGKRAAFAAKAPIILGSTLVIGALIGRSLFKNN